MIAVNATREDLGLVDRVCAVIINEIEHCDPREVLLDTRLDELIEGGEDARSFSRLCLVVALVDEFDLSEDVLLGNPEYGWTTVQSIVDWTEARLAEVPR